MTRPRTKNDGKQMRRRKLEPIHLGEILLEEFLLPLRIGQCRLAKDISVPPRRINEIVTMQRSITADTALRLARYFRMAEAFWFHLQTQFDLETLKDRLGNRLDRDVFARTLGSENAPYSMSKVRHFGKPGANARRLIRVLAGTL